MRRYMWNAENCRVLCLRGIIIIIKVKVCLTLCDHTDRSPPGSSVHGILQVRILEWVAILFSRGSSWLRDRTLVSCIGGRFFTFWASRGAPIIIKLFPIRTIWKQRTYHTSSTSGAWLQIKTRQTIDFELHGFLLLDFYKFSSSSTQLQFLKLFYVRDFPGSSVLKTLCLHCRRHGFNPCLEN